MNETFLLTALLGASVLVYGILHAREGRYDFRTPSDRRIPFIPAFVIPYFGLFPFVFVSWLLLFKTSLEEPYLLSLTMAMYSAAFFWYFFPGKTYRPDVPGNGMPDKLTRLLYKGGPHANAFPSAHVFASVISSLYLSMAFPGFSALAWFVGSVIALSTLFTKQHHVLDFAGGIAWAAASVLLATHLIG